MGNRTGIYVVFHAGGTTDPTASDMTYYNLLRAWDAHKNHEFSFTNSHDKTNSVRDSSKRETLRRALVARLNMSKSVLLIVTDKTKLDTDWVPFEIEYAIDTCGLPIICAYPNSMPITSYPPRRSQWPKALEDRVAKDGAKTFHVPFAQKPIMDAIDNYSVHSPPGWTMTWFTEEKYREWGMLPNI